jgi:imidazolonepropionase
MLRVIKRMSLNYPISIKATFLGAHAIPLEYKDNRKGYIDLLINKMLLKNKLAFHRCFFVRRVILPLQKRSKL